MRAWDVVSWTKCLSLSPSLFAWTLMDHYPELSCFWEWEFGERAPHLFKARQVGVGLFFLSNEHREQSYYTNCLASWVLKIPPNLIITVWRQNVKSVSCASVWFADLCHLSLSLLEMLPAPVNSYLVPLNGQQIYNTPAFSVLPAWLLWWEVHTAFDIKPGKVLQWQRCSIEVAGNWCTASAMLELCRGEGGSNLWLG